MEFAELRSFLVVAQEGSFSRAAERLLRTQPAVSLAVQRLEAHVGEPLFARTGRRPELTAAGRVLLDYAQRLLELRDEAALSLSGLRALERGDLTMAVDDELMPAVLALIAELRTTSPQIRVDLRHVRACDLSGRLAAGELDLGVTCAPSASAVSSAIATVVGADALVAVAPTGHPLATRRTIDPTELAAWPLVAHGEASPFRARVIDWLHAHDVEPATVLTVPTVDAAVEAVALGLGVALLPECSVGVERRAGRLVVIELADCDISRPIWVVQSARRPLAPAADRFLQAAVSRFGATPEARAATPRSPRAARAAPRRADRRPPRPTDSD